MQSNINTKHFKRYMLTHVKLMRILIFAIFLVIIALSLFFVYRTISNSTLGDGITAAKSFILAKDDKRQINILLMGIGGAGHDAPDLTDTMILMSLNNATKKMTLISIPRDIWVNDLQDKVNSAYMYGKAKGGIETGIVLAKSTVEEITGQQIDYGVVIDFGSFKDIVDAIGGIQVDVQNAFIDTQYPIAGAENDKCNNDPTFACRYMTISFQKGIQTMDGNTALEFVRSRHASGIEGNDIAREARQQLVISAILKKISNPQVFGNITTDEKLFQILQDNILTDIDLKNMGTIARFALDSKDNKKSYTIPDNLLYNPPNEYLYHNAIFTHAFVFIPNNKKSTSGSEDWSDIQKWVASVL